MRARQRAGADISGKWELTVGPVRGPVDREALVFLRNGVVEAWQPEVPGAAIGVPVDSWSGVG
jgi:hypothetical protein